MFCEIIKGLGGAAPEPEKLNVHQSYWESNIKKAVDAGEYIYFFPGFALFFFIFVEFKMHSWTFSIVDH